MQGSGAQPPATDKVYAFKSMQSDEIRHNSAIYQYDDCRCCFNFAKNSRAIDAN